MFPSKLNELLGIELPIIGGTMMDLSTAPFVTAISNAGALGLLASAIYKDENKFRDDVKAVKDGTDKPFGVNINLFPMMEKLDNNRYLDIMVEEGVKIVETSGFSPPADLVARLEQLVRPDDVEQGRVLDQRDELTGERRDDLPDRLGEHHGADVGAHGAEMLE